VKRHRSTEFSYQLLQAYDFLHLYRNHNCRVQVGGSDQWGNIIGGCDLIRRVTGGQAFGVTVPLLTTATGEKFGKSAGNAVWLESELTSCYQLYQYFYNVRDDDVGKLLRWLTFKGQSEIDAIMTEHDSSPGARIGQTAVAEAVTRLIHGDAGCKQAVEGAAALFGGGCKGGGYVSADAVLAALGDAPSVTLSKQTLQESATAAIDLFVQCGLCKGRKDYRRLVQEKGAYINDVRVESEGHLLSEEDLVDGKLIVLRRGKKQHFCVNYE
jgi:tyrosyl-tRNA synthetase